MFESHKGRFFPGVCRLSTCALESAADQHTCSSFELWKSRRCKVKWKRSDCIPNVWALRASGLESCSTRVILFALGLCCHQNRRMYVKGMSSRLKTYQRDQKRLRYGLRTRDPLVLPAKMVQRWDGAQIYRNAHLLCVLQTDDLVWILRSSWGRWKKAVTAGVKWL